MWWVYRGFGVGTEWQMPNLWSAIGRPDLAEDARFDTNPNRLTNRQALTDIIESWMATFETDAEVMSALEGARVPYGPSLSPTDALTHPHFVERGLVRTVSDPLAGTLVRHMPRCRHTADIARISESATRTTMNGSPARVTAR